MSSFATPYIFFYTANLIFLMSCLVCAYMRWQHTCPEFSDDPFYYYPARKPFIAIYLIATLEFPYLIHISSLDALLYARAFTTITYPIFLVVLVERYFFYTRFSTKRIIKTCLTPIIFLLPLLYFALKGGDEIDKYEIPIMAVAIAIGVAELALGTKGILRLYKTAKREAEEEYSNPDNFPSILAKRILILMPFIFIASAILPSLFHSGWVKLVRDVLLTIYDIWLTVSTLVSHRPLKSKESIDNENEKEDSDYHIDLDSQLLNDIIEAIISKELYKQPSLKLEDLVLAVRSNRKYVSKAISNSKWKSFYGLINSFRVVYAINMKKHHPDMKQEEIALYSGFNSRFTLSRWLKTSKEDELTEINESVAKLFKENKINSKETANHHRLE